MKSHADVNGSVLDLTGLSSQVDVSLCILRTFAAVSAPKNLFTTNADGKAFASNKVRNVK